MGTRKAVFSGSWYPDSAAECERQIHRFMAEDSFGPASEKEYQGGIVPHAGWFFSGAIACNVIRRLRMAPPPDVILIFGMHLHPASGCYIMAEGAWETPFGSLAVDASVAGKLIDRFPFQIETARRHQQDNTIELQLPFIRYFFKDVKIVPMGVPPAGVALDVGRAAIDVAAGLELTVCVLGSTDLTHYGFHYDFAPKGTGPEAVSWVKHKNDGPMIDALLAMDPDAVIRQGLKNRNACCAGAAAAAIAAARRLGSEKGEKLAYASSYEKSPGDSFVGYVGVLF